MKKVKKVIQRLLFVIIIAFSAAILTAGKGNLVTKVNILNQKVMSETDLPEGLNITFIDVGQGDSAYVTCEGHGLLIDAGDSNAFDSIKKVVGNGPLDAVAGTHPHEDHIGCMARIVKKYNPKTVFLTKADSDLKCYNTLLNAAGSRMQVLKAGDSFALGSANVSIIGPAKAADTYEDINNSSLVLIITYKGKSVLFMGDAEQDSEADILKSRQNVVADVLKVGHHGSSSSSSDRFIASVHPQYAVISCGVNNDFGHPTSKTIDTLIKNDVSYLRTDEVGNIELNISPSGDLKFHVPSGQPQWHEDETIDAILNTHTKKFHVGNGACDGLTEANKKNLDFFHGSRKKLLKSGYLPCGSCNP